LLRAPAYAGHPVDDVTPIVRQDRFEPREDQGEHVFRFWLDAGPAGERLAAIDREAAVRTEGLMALCAFPPGGGSAALPGVALDDDVVRLAALKMSEDGRALVVRLFEPTGSARETRVRIPALGLEFPVALAPFELLTLLVDLATRTVGRADLLERAEVAR
jgi:alpha-mannosidase